ncbi:hypothetical protein BGW36DRAFT_297085 [Talaromyces proteolyticus]|uniref:Uncharacterized protein n=1 Tax=Talaromyces proteolyticus TaxID=1131652 RepID=A0AAD4PZ62_9EURO|nr:uncharacterized protein BGW36DRAFT_297085 [Talaromyces proteolyticus]KAH8696082.1 hypothetical protein BGW36DRAFT_297085 [Talaromyces proteolyticus]
MSPFTFANSSQSVPGEIELAVSFTIKADPSTDVWEKPPSTRSFNAPILYRSMPLRAFKRARVSVMAAWETLYDQGGLILVIHQTDGERKWIKAGIEYVQGKARLSVVAKDRWSDWSLVSIPSGGSTATIEMVREEDGSLWVYWIEGVQRVPLREVTWAFEQADSAHCWIGTFAARPSSPADGGRLAVDFCHLVVDAE